MEHIMPVCTDSYCLKSLEQTTILIIMDEIHISCIGIILAGINGSCKFLKQGIIVLPLYENGLTGSFAAISAGV